MHNILISSTAIILFNIANLSYADTKMVQAETFNSVDEIEMQRFAPSTTATWSVTLPALESKLLPKTQTNGINKPLQVGIGRNLPNEQAIELTPAALGWQVTSDGGQIAILNIASDGARAIRAALQVFAMPEAAQLRVFAPDIPGAKVFAVTGTEINTRLNADRAARDEDETSPLLYWLPIVQGNSTGVEIYLPKHVPVTDVRIAIPKLAHILSTPYLPLPVEKGVSDSGTCTADISCYIDDWGDVANAVARMYMNDSEGNTYMCSGSLINDKDPASQVPYFITARHCISTQALASTLQTYWFFRTASCNGSFSDSSLKILSGGSTMLFTSPATDITLVRLNSMPPTGTTMVGWDANQVPRNTGVGNVSHPKGDLQKFASGTMKGYVHCYFPTADNIQDCGATPTDIGNYMMVKFNLGMIQPGSSGSGLFLNNSHILVGIASNGAWIDTNDNGLPDCGETVLQINFGRFDVAYDEGMKNLLNVSNPCDVEPGDWNYCSNPACGPCKEGMGDCDADTECQTGLICTQNAGANYGWETTLDVCTKSDITLANNQCTREPGAWDYCSDPKCGPCISGQGDCDSNSECQGGLVCLPNTGATYGFPAAVATCGLAPATTCNREPGDWGYCSDQNCDLCTEGLGDCDSDSECSPGLECRANIGGNYGFPATMDVCVLPTERICTKAVGDWGYCSDPACGPCQIGQGDCDQDSECNNGLFCAFNGGEPHNLPSNMDVCEPKQP
jgi:V8-like Glu-specific endopeptidase